MEDNNLLTIWNNKPPKRYLPRSFDGGSGWGVYDVMECKFISDEKLVSMTRDECLENFTN